MAMGPGREEKSGRGGLTVGLDPFTRRARFSARSRVTCIFTLTSSMGVLFHTTKEHQRVNEKSREEARLSNDAR